MSIALLSIFMPAIVWALGFLAPPLEVFKMNVMIDFCLIPLGVGVSLSPYIVRCQQILASSELKYQMHAYGTNIEGEWNEVMAAIKECHESIHDMGAPRITSTIKLGTRVDRDQGMDDKIRSVNEKLCPR